MLIKESDRIYYLPEEKVMFLGDADCGDYYELEGKMDKERLGSMKKYLFGFDIEKYYIGHDVPQSKKDENEYLEEEYTNL